MNNTDNQLADKLNIAIKKLENKWSIRVANSDVQWLRNSLYNFISYAILVDDNVTFTDTFDALEEHFSAPSKYTSYRHEKLLLAELVAISRYVIVHDQKMISVSRSVADSYAIEHHLPEVKVTDDDTNCLHYYEHETNGLVVEFPDFINFVEGTPNLHKFEVILDTINNSYSMMHEDFNKQDSALYNTFMVSLNEMLHDYLHVAVPYVKADYLNKKQAYLSHQNKVNDSAQAILDDFNLG